MFGPLVVFAILPFGLVTEATVVTVGTVDTVDTVDAFQENCCTHITVIITW